MDKLIGKTLVFTDQHFGIKSNSPSRQKIGVMAIKNMLDAISKDKISNVIFCGDYFHQRNSLTVDTLNIAYKCLQAFAKKCNVYMILGNHDLFNKNSTDVNSINIFRDNSNIKVIDKPTEILLNDHKALLVPWLSDLTNFKTSTYDFLFGHFDISAKFLISSYAQDHSRKAIASKDVANSIDNDSYLNASDDSSSKPEDLLGSFIELVKPGKTVFAGHIHQHKEMTVKKRKFIFVGSPYQQNLGDIDCDCGFYEIDEIGNYEFIKMENLPKHVQFKSSDIVKNGIDNYDFSLAKGNIVQKVYDTDMSMEDDLKVNQKIASFRPYEELLPDYRVAIDFTKEDTTSQSSNLVKMLKKSKLDYIASYIDQLDGKALEGMNIEKTKLLNTLITYYNIAIGEN